MNNSSRTPIHSFNKMNGTCPYRRNSFSFDLYSAHTSTLMLFRVQEQVLRKRMCIHFLVKGPLPYLNHFLSVMRTLNWIIAPNIPSIRSKFPVPGHSHAERLERCKKPHGMRPVILWYLWRIWRQSNNGVWWSITYNEVSQALIRREQDTYWYHSF